MRMPIEQVETYAYLIHSFVAFPQARDRPSLSGKLKTILEEVLDHTVRAGWRAHDVEMWACVDACGSQAVDERQSVFAKSSLNLTLIARDNPRTKPLRSFLQVTITLLNPLVSDFFQPDRASYQHWLIVEVLRFWLAAVARESHERPLPRAYAWVYGLSERIYSYSASGKLVSVTDCLPEPEMAYIDLRVAKGIGGRPRNGT